MTQVINRMIWLDYQEFNFDINNLETTTDKSLNFSTSLLRNQKH